MLIIRLRKDTVGSTPTRPTKPIKAFHESIKNAHKSDVCIFLPEYADLSRAHISSHTPIDQGALGRCASYLVGARVFDVRKHLGHFCALTFTSAKNNNDRAHIPSRARGSG